MFKIYAEPESPNQGACSRYMIYNPGPENHKKYPEKTKIRPESVRLLQVLYNPGPENHKKYPKKNLDPGKSCHARRLHSGTRVCCQDGTVSFQGDSDALISKGSVKLSSWHNSWRGSTDLRRRPAVACQAFVLCWCCASAAVRPRCRKPCG